MSKKNRIEVAFGWAHKLLLAVTLIIVGMATGVAIVPPGVQPDDLVSLKAEVMAETKRLIEAKNERRVVRITTPIVIGPDKPEKFHRRAKKTSQAVAARRADILHALAERKQKLTKEPIELVFGE